MELTQMSSSQVPLVENGAETKPSPPSYEESQRRASQGGGTTSKKGAKKRRVTIDVQVSPETENPEEGGVPRGAWGNQLEFLLTCVSYAVGLGNVWRFPYLCYKNGGGAFLIPYVLMLLLCGLPIFFMELAFGQFASLGPISIWKCCPMMKGLGFGMVTVSWYICLYFAVLIAYILFFLFSSFASDVPWKTCDNDWNTNACDDGNSFNSTINSTINSTANPITDDIDVVRRSPAHEFFYRNVLQQSQGIDDLGAPEYRLTLLLLLCWVLVCLGLLKGVQSLGKVSYFTAIFPYILITVLIVKGATLKGAAQGIKFYIEPKWEKLADPQVWADAAVQIFYSLGPCMGTLITMSSYNTFKNNCLKNALTVAFINCCTSIYSGFAIFSVVGYMAHKANTTVDKVADTGPGLAFVVYPEGLAQMPVSPLWASLFFFMMFTIGMGSMLSQLETVIAALLDEFPIFKTTKKKMTMFRVGICVFGFLLGLPQVTKGGFYLLTIMDNFVGGINLLILGFVEIVTIIYIYGFEHFASDIELMLGKRPNLYWKICWKYVTLLAIGFIMLFLMFNWVAPKCNDYEYPAWAISMGWCISISSVIWLPLMAIKTYGDRSGMWQEMKAMFHPDGDWGPAQEEDRLGRYAGPGFDREKLDGDLEAEEEELLVNINRRAPIPGPRAPTPLTPAIKTSPHRTKSSSSSSSSSRD